MSAKELAVNRAKMLLAAAGARYVILSSDGGVITSPGIKWAIQEGDHKPIGTLDIPKPKSLRPKTSLAHVGYIEGLKALQPGEVWSYVAPNQKELDSVQKSCSSHATRVIGAGKYITSKNSKTLTIEVLRVE